MPDMVAMAAALCVVLKYLYNLLDDTKDYAGTVSQRCKSWWLQTYDRGFYCWKNVVNMEIYALYRLGLGHTLSGTRAALSALFDRSNIQLRCVLTLFCLSSLTKSDLTAITL